jgi:hypothetical protein
MIEIEIQRKVMSYGTGMPHPKRLAKVVGGNKLDDKILQWKKGSVGSATIRRERFARRYRSIGVLNPAINTFSDCSFPTYCIVQLMPLEIPHHAIGERDGSGSEGGGGRYGRVLARSFLKAEIITRTEYGSHS